MWTYAGGRFSEPQCGGELMAAMEAGGMTLLRLVLDYRSGELVVRCLYRSSLDGPNPNTKGRGREVQDLAREGLRRALASLEGDAELVGCSGFTQREDVLSAITSSGKAKLKRGVLGERDTTDGGNERSRKAGRGAW